MGTAAPRHRSTSLWSVEQQAKTPSFFPEVNKSFALCETRQAKREVEIVFSLLRAIGASSFLEIGVFNGGSFAAFASALTEPTGGEGTLAVGVDLTRECVDEEERRLRLDRTADHVALIEGDSTLRTTYDLVSKKISQHRSGGQVDFLFIDGCHDYEVVLSDWETYRHLVRPGGIVGFHDIQEGYRGGSETWTRAGKVFREIPSKKHQKIALLGSQNWGGIGLVYL